VDVRIIFTTNRDLAALAADGEFLPDLEFRIRQSARIEVPPLRERPEDVTALVEHFVRALAQAHGRTMPEIAPEAMELLKSQPWPGNIRELAGVMQNVLLRCGARIEAGDVVAASHPQGPSATMELEQLARLPRGERLTRKVISRALELCRHCKAKAARGLGVPLRTLYRHARKHDIR